MKKRWMLALTLIACLVVLAACQSSEPERFQVKTNGSTATPTSATGTNDGVLIDGEYYDPLAEEETEYGGDWAEELPTPEPATATPAPTFRGEYAGATPVPIDPIDKPTPTPVPPLAAFSYRTYDATKLGLSFDGPTGWTVNSDDPAYYEIQNPSAGIYPATLTLHMEKVSKQYSETELKTVVKGMLDAIGAMDIVVEFSPSDTASRTLLEAKGIYADYTAVLSDGSEVRGRVHATCVEKVLYTVHLSAPKAYWTEYKDGVYDKVRHTMKITK